MDVVSGRALAWGIDLPETYEQMVDRETAPHSPANSLRALILNASLKPGPEASNTGELAAQVVEEMEKHAAGLRHDAVRLADYEIPVGVKANMGKGDDWPEISKLLLKADIVLFATPIWWGDRSSLMQRVIERMDDFDEQYLKSGKNLIYNKVAGIVITGSEDGAMSTFSHLAGVLTWLGFTLPPESGAYWVGEVGRASPQDAQKRRRNKSTQKMIHYMARNLVKMAQTLKSHPLPAKAEEKHGASTR
jgi:multimeric flavodoxin WrbA